MGGKIVNNNRWVVEDDGGKLGRKETNFPPKDEQIPLLPHTGGNEESLMCGDPNISVCNQRFLFQAINECHIREYKEVIPVWHRTVRQPILGTCLQQAIPSRYKLVAGKHTHSAFSSCLVFISQSESNATSEQRNFNRLTDSVNQTGQPSWPLAAFSSLIALSMDAWYGELLSQLGTIRCACDTCQKRGHHRYSTPQISVIPRSHITETIAVIEQDHPTNATGMQLTDPRN